MTFVDEDVVLCCLEVHVHWKRKVYNETQDAKTINILYLQLASGFTIYHQSSSDLMDTKAKKGNIVFPYSVTYSILQN